jgi:hypothetical protein
MPLWLTVTIAIFTILGSGVVSGVVTYKLNASQKEREFRREKLEECFRAVHHYLISLTTHYLVWAEVMSGKLTYDQANDMIIAEGKREDREYPLLAELLIRLYFPSLQTHFDTLLKTRDELSRLQSEFGRSYRRNGPTGDYREQRKAYIAVIKQLDAHDKDLKNAICVLADKLRVGANVA